jgi:dienelactone hydrolase
MAPILKKEVTISGSGFSLAGILSVPENSIGIVVFAHGSGSGRMSPRNRYVAEELNKNNCATLLADLLTEEEDKAYETRFDIALLMKRLLLIIDWLKKQEETKTLPLGIFGASTGAAAALDAASLLGSDISAVVSRGGRPDLSREYFSNIVSPVLLIVGSNDRDVLMLNKKTFNRKGTKNHTRSNTPV